MKKQKRFARFCMLLSVVLLGNLLSCFTAYAGSINGNEQSIVSVIYGQFEQGGVVYKVRQEYINSALGYLQQDDVDLTAEQAQSVISEIYANVSTGVESGYLEPVGGTQAQVPPTENQSNGQNTENGSASSKGENQGETGTNGEPITPGDSESGEIIEENPISDGNSEEGGQSPDESDSSGEGNDLENDIPEDIIPKIPPVISILELVDKAPPQSYEYLSRDTDALMGQIQIPYQSILYAICILAVIVALVAVVSFWKQLLTHHRHRKLRKYLKYILTLETAALSAVCLMIGGVWIGAFQDSAVLNKLADTGYYHAIYEDLRRDTSISFALLDIPEVVMDEAITYERVVMAARQQVESDLSQGVYQADTTILTGKLESDIRSYLEGKSVTMTKQAELGLGELMNRLNEKYSSLLRWPFAAWWVQLKIEFFSFVKIALPLSLLLVIISQLLVIFLNHYKHRGVVLCGRGLLAGGLATAAAYGGGLLWFKRAVPEVSPEYMGTFFGFYGNGIWRAGMITGSIGILLGLIYLVAVHTWKEGKR